jgi:hypothetical protein
MADSGDPAIPVRDVVKDFGPRRVIEGLLVGDLVIAGVLDVVYLAVGGVVLAAAYRSVRTRGLLSRPGY